ncbi:hypothetical protein VNO77_20488 [Canavalia gladiata]|uniref:3'-5' exonuclease domain-containing protein n=1 Tax=Canavalia gladiata TaxID=3824 RepID=A0AAN9LUG4_CANGL
MISTVRHQASYETHSLYDVTFFSDLIRTHLTSTPSIVDSWISDTITRNVPPIVGLDIEWRPNTEPNMNNPVATLQLCAGTGCLVFHIIHAPFIPQSLVAFLRDPSRTFVGVGIEADVLKLRQNYALTVTNYRDLRFLAAEKYGSSELIRAGLKMLSLTVLGLEVNKPHWITRSGWDIRPLTLEQVQYATIDAFVSFEIGRHLLTSV